MTGNAIAVQAPAKVNLFLQITGRRDDGYHLLDSLICFAGPADRLRLAVHDAPEPMLSIDGPFAGPLRNEGDNLILDAITALAGATGHAPAIAATLTKNLPIAAGIGGGSADAAATLRGLTRLWRLGAEHRALLPGIAEDLGADVPICLDGRPARVSGIGEIIDPVTLPALPLLLVNPLVPCPTGPVFAARQSRFSAQAPALPGMPSTAELADWLARETRNDLEQAAIDLVPEIATVLAALHAQPHCLLARMSGSGATCFALFAGDADRDAAAMALKRAHPGWWVGV